MVENYQNVMQNPPISSQMLVLLWEASQLVLVPKFSVVLELQAIKVKSTKKVNFSKEIQKLKCDSLNLQSHWKFWNQNLLRSFPHYYKKLRKKL